MSTPIQHPSTAHRRLYSTAQAAHVLLGGTEAAAYWGFTFGEFVDKLQAAMLKHIGNPADAPWRRQVDYTTADYIELQELLDSMDSVRDPANQLDQPLARSFARRCDVVGIHGGVNSIGVGKDTVALALKPHGFASLAFADPLKASLSMTYGVPMRYFVDRSLKEAPLPGMQGGLTPRKLMQAWGTEVIRSVENKTLLLRHQIRVASAILDLSNIARQHPDRVSATNGVRIVIPDVRFPDESEYVHAVGGFNAWVSRPSLRNNELSNGHASEAGIPRHPTDLDLVNEGTLEQFQAHAAKEVLSRFGPPHLVAARRAPRP